MNHPGFFKKIFSHQYTILALRLIVGVTFIYASLDKIAHPDQFARIVYNYKVLPSSLINVFAVILPWIELVSGIFLVLGIFVEGSAFVITALLIVFVVAVSVNLIRGVDLNCGCFSTDPQGKKEGVELLIREFLLLASSGLILLYPTDFFGLSSLYKRVLLKNNKI